MLEVEVSTYAKHSPDYATPFSNTFRAHHTAPNEPKLLRSRTTCHIPDRHHPHPPAPWPPLLPNVGLFGWFFLLL